ncbi:hypothetical protein [Nonomuraea ferruginea]|uniref:ABC transporter permease n=1 Tax=Nonomuraea ferruginea TaxID=46174 RepID=A0ABT4T775_9ACTN|nr:hypothetical protein [Nonomuraea ferruginea]MDA0644861.1 hypothetical protein [Nonomuraea ferruginea]
MSSDALSGHGPAVRPEDLKMAEIWLTGHGLPDVRPTPLLAVRLAVRRRARLANAILPAGLFIGAALAYVSGESGLHAMVPVLILIVLVVGMLLAQALLDRWVRRVDRRAGEALPRRTAHLAQPGWQALLGRPRAVFIVATFAGATALVVSALTVQDADARYAALVVLVGVAGAGAGIVLQLRDLLARPIVAEDEASLTADVIMRIEDAREAGMPTVPWSLPVVLIFGAAPLWWKVASIALVIIGMIALVVITMRTPSSVTTARRVMSLS